MKTKLDAKLGKTFGLMVTAALAFGALPALADEGHNHQHQATEHEANDGVYESSESIWVKINEQHGTLSAVVKDGKLDMVHEHAFAIRDLAKKLSTFAPEEKKDRVKSSIAAIAKLANDLDSSGDAGDQIATDSNLKKFDGMLKVLEAQFETHEH